MRARWCGRLLLPAILFALTACGPVDFSRRAGNAGQSLNGTAAKRTSGSPSEALATVRREIRRQLAAENYRSALNLLRKEIKGGRPEAALTEEYGLAINGVLLQAERDRKQGFPEKAGELFRAAHDGYPKTEAVAKMVSLPPPEILVRIEDCVKELMERGLVAYRAGNLDRAIRTWKTIHAFSPRHQASRKAMETAEVQRANLEKVGAKR